MLYYFEIFWLPCSSDACRRSRTTCFVVNKKLSSSRDETFFSEQISFQIFLNNWFWCPSSIRSICRQQRFFKSIFLTIPYSVKRVRKVFSFTGWDITQNIGNLRQQWFWSLRERTLSYIYSHNLNTSNCRRNHRVQERGQKVDAPLRKLSFLFKFKRNISKRKKGKTNGCFPKHTLEKVRVINHICFFIRSILFITLFLCCCFCSRQKFKSKTQKALNL